MTVQYDDRLESIEEMVKILGGTPTKKSMNVIPFRPEMRALTYVMIQNLSHEPDDIVHSKENLLVRSIHSQGD